MTAQQIVLKKIILVFSVFLLTCLSAQSVFGGDYFYDNTSFPLYPVADQLSVVFEPSVRTEANMQRILRQVLQARMKGDGERITPRSRVVRLYSKLADSERIIFLQKLQQQPEIRSAAPVYRVPQSHVRFTVNQEIIVRFESGMDKKQIQNFASVNGLILQKEIAVQTWLLEVEPELERNALSAANALNDRSEVLWAQPNFIYLNYGILNSSVNDPLWPSQWAHVNTGQTVASGADELGFPATVNGFADADMDVDLAWDELTGNGGQAGGSASVLVAMLDSGVDLDHPDIQVNLYSTGKDFTSDGQSDANDTHGHGTCTAGIVAAVADNGQGVAGVAYNVKILPVRIMNEWGVTTSDQLTQAMDYAWQQGADIISNSWGGTTPDQALTDAIHRAKTEGRDGKGCVILFSSGNEGYGNVNYPGSLDDVMAVGASNMFDEKKNSGSRDYNRKWSANYGAALDIVAPTIVYTSDIQGSAGYVEGDYFDHFGGTSAACPNAAGVAALVLSANSAYTSDDVQNILQQSADKIERYPYNSSGWNKHVGYGRVNAYNAVRMAFGNDGSVPLLLHEVPASTRSIEPLTIQADITDNSGVATGDAAPRLFYRAILGTDTSAWNSVTDTDGPSGNTYDFTIPGQKWSTQIHYYFYVQDNSAQQNGQTYPAGGNGSTHPDLFYTFHVGNFTSETFNQPNTVSWENNWQDYHTSTLDIGADYKIVNLTVTVDYSGNLNEAGIDLSGPDQLGAGLAMYYEGTALSNTTFDDEAALSITEGSDPFSGSYRADNGLFTFDGKRAAGTWQIGVYDGTYTGSNDGSINSWSLNITRMIPDAPPVVDDIPAQSTNEGGTFSIINLDDYVSDADHPDDSLSWTYSGNTDLIVEINAQRQAMVSVPDEDWNGSEVITFTATDPGGYSDSDTVRFTVNPVNDAPVVSDIPNQTTDEGSAFADIPLNDYVSDIDNADSDISWSVSGNTDLIVEINSETHIAQVRTPNTDWSGSETITFIATDPGSLSDSDPAVFTVNAVNDAPVVSDIPDQTVDEGESFADVPLNNYVNDVDNTDAELTWTYGGNQELSVQINAETHVAHIDIPSADWTGSEAIIFTATDPGGLADSDTALFTVTAVNDPPVASDIPDQTVSEGESFTQISLDDYVSDSDNGDAELTWTYKGNHDLQVAISAERIATISTPDSNWNGSETITFTATDPGGLSDSNAAVFTVMAVNDAPVITSTPQTEATQDRLYQYQVTATDADSGDVLRYHLLTGPGFLSMDSLTGLISGTPSDSDVGTHEVRVDVRDSSAATDTQTYELTVDNTNDPPIVSDIPDQTVSEEESFTQISLDDYVSDSDNGDAELTWTYKGNHDLQVAISTERIATISTPDSNWNGSETISFTATDPGGLSDSNAAVFTVTAVNDAPVITEPLPLLSFAEDDSLVIPESFWYPYVNDPDDADSALYYELRSLYNRVQVQEEPERGTCLTAPENWFGTDTLMLTVRDDSAADSAQVVVSVTAVNDAPQIVSLPDSLTFVNTVTDTIDLTPWQWDVDTPGSRLSWHFLVSDSALKTRYESATQTLYLSAPAFEGRTWLYMELTDDSSAVDRDTLLVRVTKQETGWNDMPETLPVATKLFPNYPNPFNPVTTIPYKIGTGNSASVLVTLTIYNALGQKLTELVNREQPPGTYCVRFDARHISSGVYWVRLQTGKGFVQTRKLLLIK